MWLCRWMHKQEHKPLLFSNSFLKQTAHTYWCVESSSMPFPIWWHRWGKSSEALCHRHNTDILQRVKERRAERWRQGRQAGRQTEKGQTGTNRDKEGRKLADRDRCGDCSSRDRWEGREKKNNEEVLAPSAAREWNMLSPFRWETRGSQRYMQQHTHNPLWMVSDYIDCVSVCACVCMCVFCSKCARVCVCGALITSVFVISYPWSASLILCLSADASIRAYCLHLHTQTWRNWLDRYMFWY